MHCYCKNISAFFSLSNSNFWDALSPSTLLSLPLLTIFEKYQAWTWISLLYFQGPQEIAVVHCCCKNTSAILFFSYQTQMVTYERGSCEHCHQKCITFLSNSVVKIDAHLISQNNYFLRQFLYPYYLKRKSFILKKLQVWKLLFLMVPVGIRKNQWPSAYFGGEHISAVEWMVPHST